MKTLITTNQRCGTIYKSGLMVLSSAEKDKFTAGSSAKASFKGGYRFDEGDQ